MKKEITPGMKVKHHLINEELIVVADENGPAYTGTEFKDNEISLSYAIIEYNAGNLSISQPQDESQKELFTPGNYFVEKKSAGIAIYSDTTRSGRNKEIIAAIWAHGGTQEEREAMADLFAASTDMYSALKWVTELTPAQLSDTKTVKDYIRSIIKKANPHK